MDKSMKPQSFDNSASHNQNILNHEPGSQQQVHQHKIGPHYYPLIHQHLQIKNHPHPAQSPLLLNINNQQMIHTTAHRHFQHYPQYGVNVNSNDYAHQHMPKINQATIPQNQQQNNVEISTVQQNNHSAEESLKQEQAREVQTKTPTPKPKAKESERKQLRSPSARRPANAPVAMQGWLHKQGSEGFMLWKKRWFVLSEYCLFYYKGAQEEKLLGSILLPSYKVSVCGPEDKVNRKFAFKCEHANMRTYILAADSQELMMQWVHILNLACNLQNNIELSSDHPRSQHIESIPSKSPVNQTSVSRPSNSHMHIHSSSNTTDLSNSSQQELNQYNQPLYANAPPKPRRLTDGYCSPGLEALERYANYHPGPSSAAKSPSSAYRRQIEHPDRIGMQIYGERMLLGPQNIDRRTPDTYGRSNLTKYKNPSDYEDIYAEQSAYKRPLSPVASDNLIKKGYPSVNLGYPIKGYAPPSIEILRAQYPESIPMRKPPAQAISRPHSADFLEYKPNKLEPNPSATSVSQQARPKSSLDINMCSKDCDVAPRSNFINPGNRSRDNDYFYSQERYAEKMRKSAQYLQKMPLKYQPVDPTHRKHRERYDLDFSNSYGYNYPFKEPVEAGVNAQPVRSRSALSEGSLLCAQDIENESLNREGPMTHEQHLGHNVKTTLNHDQFIRSASARLSQNNRDDQILDESVTRMEGERKREESMKRLLEWKQRMLQSPLNRKAQAQTYKGYGMGKENIYSYQNYVLDRKQKKSVLPNKTSMHNLVQYNSYSSDDEASGSISINPRDNTLQRDTFPRAIAKRSITPNIPPNLQARSITNLDRPPYKNDKNIPGYPTWSNHPQYLYEQEQDFKASQNINILNMDHIQRMENLQKLERIKQNLLELEKQYEKRKPLVNLVDNMVKLGSLYRNPNERNDMTRHIRERLEFNQHIQERRLLAEEKREWNRIEPSHIQLQEKVRQLYQLDGLIQEESRNLHNLQRDKEDIERALSGLRNRLIRGLNNPEEIEQARRQQFILENELSRVHLMLAQNSKKLEETVAGNARLEQELLVLKQKLQSSRHQRCSPQFSNAGESLPYLSDTSQVLETDLEKVQKKIGDLQKQREELSLQVRQLTDKSTATHSHQNLHLHHHENQSGNKKRPTSFWRETDLDSMNFIDHGYESFSSTTPLYINTDVKSLGGNDFADRNLKTSDSTSDDTALSSNQLEKQEIKTVRIVKRESERRQRDREKTFNGKCDPLVEEDDSSQGSSILFRPTSLPQKLPFDHQHHSLPTRSSRNKPAELSPVFKSEAARQIITEVSKKEPTAQGQRRAVPKERRRHHTAPHDNLVCLGNLEGRRARDDLDIERALRQRIDAPDIVRSTLSNKELKYNEETIDNILSTPNKILIPERYIPEQLPQPSAEEQEKRKKKVESIKKMLSDTAIISAPPSTSHTDDKTADKKATTSTKSGSTSSIMEEKKQREHLLQLNQILAKQVMEISKVVAGSTEADNS